MERVLAPQKWSSHILLQRRNANLMSFWKYNKGSSSKTFASHKVSRFLYNECWNYISFFSDSNSHFDLDFRHALLDAWGKFYLDYYYECVLNMIITELQIFRSSTRMYFVFCLVFCITSGSMNSNCIFVVSIQLRWPPKRSIIHFVPNLKLLQ